MLAVISISWWPICLLIFFVPVFEKTIYLRSLLGKFDSSQFSNSLKKLFQNSQFEIIMSFMKIAYLIFYCNDSINSCL